MTQQFAGGFEIPDLCDGRQFNRRGPGLGRCCRSRCESLKSGERDLGGALPSPVAPRMFAGGAAFGAGGFVILPQRCVHVRLRIAAGAQVVFEQRDALLQGAEELFGINHSGKSLTTDFTDFTDSHTFFTLESVESALKLRP